VFLFAHGKIIKQFDFSRNVRFITALVRDTRGNIWLTIPGLPHTYAIDTNFNLNRYSVPLEGDGVINMVRQGHDGMYITSSGKHSYLFFKPPADTTFQNISIPIPFTLNKDFNVSDFVIAEDHIWLASSEGLLRFDRQHIERVDLGERFTALPIKSIHAHPGNKLLVANAIGLLLYQPRTGVFDLFNESSGLKSNTITARGLFIGSLQNVWIGTAKGLCYSTHPLSQLHKTPTPRFTRVRAQGKKIDLRSGHEIEYGSYLSFQASSITFPENEINLQYRILPNRGWKTANDTELHFTATDIGTHTLEVRSKKNGPYSWSDAAQLTFVVGKPFWGQSWFLVLCFTAAAVLIAGTTVGVNAHNKTRNRELQRLIDDRTHALRRSNEELIDLNLEKNNLIGIVAHDLRSPLSQIKGLLTIIQLNCKLDEEPARYLGMIDTSIARLNDMILKILDVDAIESKQLNLNMETVSLSDLCNIVADRYGNEASRKNISISKLITPAVCAMVDKNYTEQVLENLLSNAIKFSPHKRNVCVTLRTQGNKAVCEIKDEGPGISEKDKKKLFGKYQKLSSKPTGNEISTGLGLSIVKKFVNAMDGEIWCESEEGKGACFIVAFARA
jgi:signal transduction histidine kinase